MLQFLQSWLWLFGVIAALPILLHLLSRQRLKKIRFSSLMLLARLEKSQMRRLRLRQLLLLILRTLAVLLLVFAFARPLLRNREAPLLGTQTAAVLVVDRSASMTAMADDGRRIDAARAVGRRIVETLRPGDRVAVMSDTGGTEAPDFEYSSAEWNALVEGIVPGHGTANLGSAISRAYAALDTVTVGSREVYVITDGQRSAWSALPPGDHAGVQTGLLKVGGELQPNRGLRDLDFGGSLWIAHAPLIVQARVANHGPEVRDLPVSLFLDGNRVAQTSVYVNRSDSTIVSLRVDDIASGWHRGRVEVSADAWRDDNVLYFALEAAEDLPVLVVAEDDRLLAPVRAALRPGARARTPFLPESVTPAALGGEIDPRYGLVVLAGVSSLPPPSWQRLLRFVEKGGGLYVLPGPETQRDNLERNLLEPLWSTRLIDGPRVDSDSLAGRPHRGARTRSFVTLEEPARHELFDYLRDASNYPEIRFYGAARLGAVDQSAVRQRFSDGSAALIEARSGQGRVILLAGYAHPDESDLVYHPLFVPMTQSIATYIARRGALGSAPSYRVGERPPGLPAGSGDWLWVTPSGDTTDLPGGPAKLPVLLEAGIHSLLSDGRTVSMFAANVDPHELDLTPVTRWEEVMGSSVFVELDAEASLSEEILEARTGVDLWLPAILFALLVLLLEMLVAWPRASEIEPRP